MPFLDVSPNPISTRQSPPSISVSLVIADTLDVPVDYLVVRTNNPKSHKHIIPDNVAILPNETLYINAIRPDKNEIQQTHLCKVGRCVCFVH